MSEPTKIDMIRIERINEMMKEQNLTQSQFAQSIGMTPENLNRIIRHKVNFTETTAKRIISHHPGYNLEWLLGYSDLKTQEEKKKVEYNYCDELVERYNRYTKALTYIFQYNLGSSGLTLKYVKDDSIGYYSIVDEKGNEVKRLSVKEVQRFMKKIDRICMIMTDDILNPTPIFS